MSVAAGADGRLTDRALEFVARRFRLLGDPQRLRILGALMDGELSVNDLADACGCGQANVSKHLGLLRTEGLVEFRQDGNRRLYRIADPTVPALCRTVCNTLEERYAARLERLRGVTTTEGTARRPRGPRRRDS